MSLTTPRALLIQFDYQYYCQGYEWDRGHVMLVYAVNFQQACEAILRNKGEFPAACNFINRTIG